MTRHPRVEAVVPTLGASPHLERCLDALLGQAGVDVAVTLVEQRPVAGPVPAAVRRLEAAGARGFAAAANAGLAATAAGLVALVNDDAVVERDWLATLCAAILSTPDLAAVQGTHRLGVATETAAGGSSRRILDGVGLAFNRWWQAVQIGRDLGGGEVVAPDRGPFEVLGVSATAALYRRPALERVRLPIPGPGLAVFDPVLESYYEDADLACRLRGAGLRAAWVPAAAVDHAGSASASAAPGTPRPKLLARNRPLVVARLLGRRFPFALPRMLARDLADLRRNGLLATLAGWGAALRLLPRFAHAGPALVPSRTLRALSAEAAHAALARRSR